MQVIKKVPGLYSLALGGLRARDRLSRRLHRALARASAHRRYVVWSWRKLAIRRREPGRPFVAISMVEHLGDVVATEPVSRYVRERYPDAYLVWVVGERYRELVEHNPHLDGVLSIGCLSEWVVLRNHNLFDRVVDLQVEGRDCARCGIPLRKSEGNREIDLLNYYHHGNLLEIFSQCAGLPLLSGGPRLHLPPECERRVDALGLPERYIVLHCAANRSERDWDAEKWRALAAELLAAGMHVVEIGLEPVIASAHPGYVDLCGRLSILETAEVIRRAHIFVGIDSGPAHLANAAGTYGVILLGSFGDFQRYMPYSGGYQDGSNADLLYADGPASSIPVRRVVDVLTRRLEIGAAAPGASARAASR